jgi:MFS transporter, DHA2 family, multidrug resistance protein
MNAVFTPQNQLLAAFGLALALFMQVLDSTIANVALPAISGNLGASAQQGTWVITAFSVSNAIAMPLTGWLSRRIGEVKLFLFATILFVAMSFLCGLAQNLGTLIFFRALQGFFAGPLYPMVQSLMIAIFPVNKRSVALAFISMIAVVAPIAGPVLGGWITDNYSWPWIFFINLPIGVFSVYVVWTQMRTKTEVRQRTSMDYVGLITLALGVGCLQILLDTGNDQDWFESKMIIALAIISAVSIVVFVIWELTEQHPIVNLRLFRHRNFTVATIAYTFAYGAFIGGGLLVPLWLQTQLGYTALWSGLAMAPLGFFPIVLTPLVGKFAPRFELRLVASSALLFFGVIFYLRSAFTLDIDFAHVAQLQLLQGIGIALFFMPLLTILLSDLEGSEITDGAGLSTFFRTLGASFAISITTYMWNHRAVVHHAQLTEIFTPTNPATLGVIKSIGGGDVQMAMVRMDAMITQQAFQIAFNDIFRALAFVLISMTFFVWLTKPPFFRTAANAPKSAPSGEI